MIGIIRIVETRGKCDYMGGIESDQPEAEVFDGFLGESRKRGERNNQKCGQESHWKRLGRREPGGEAGIVLFRISGREGVAGPSIHRWHAVVTR